MQRSRLFFYVFLLAAGCSPWRTFDSPQGHYTVSFPGEPEQAGVRQNTALGYVNGIRASVTAGYGVFTVTSSELPADLLKRAGVKAVLQGQQQLEVSASKDKIIDVQWDADLQGMRFTYLRESGDGVGCYYVVRGSRLFLLTVEGPFAEARGSQAARFFDSLEVSP